MTAPEPEGHAIDMTSCTDGE
jgi:hypothetical protein